jgi:2',3'-cyclic-nucleotide 2'-phosphodiesterase (5'-nucleotidase family)
MFLIQVAVVQVYCYSKYLGQFDLYFDANGELKTPVDGVGVKNASVILLDKDIKEDPDVLKKIQEYRPNMTEFTRTVGVTVNKLRRNGLWESNLGNAITDGMIQVKSI